MTYRNTNTQDGGLAPPNRFPIKYEINGNIEKFLPSTGAFGAFGRPSTALTEQEALMKAEQQLRKFPQGTRVTGSVMKRGNAGPYFLIYYTSPTNYNGGKRKNKTSHRHRSTRRKSMRRTTRRRRG